MHMHTLPPIHPTTHPMEKEWGKNENACLKVPNYSVHTTAFSFSKNSKVKPQFSELDLPIYPCLYSLVFIESFLKFFCESLKVGTYPSDDNFVQICFYPFTL